MRVGFGLDGIVLLELVDVRAGDKSLLATAGEDDHADVAIGRQVGEDFTQLLHGGHVERVEHLGTVNGDVSDLVLFF